MADNLGNVLQSVETPINQILSNSGIIDFLQKNTITGTVALIFVVLYGGAIAPRFPQLLKPLANNLIFKIIFFIFLAYTANSNPSIAITTGVVFLVSMMFLEKRETDKFIDFSAQGLMNMYNDATERVGELYNEATERAGELLDQTIGTPEEEEVKEDSEKFIDFSAQGLMDMYNDATERAGELYNEATEAVGELLAPAEQTEPTSQEDFSNYAVY
jgi:hypothetical protein